MDIETQSRLCDMIHAINEMGVFLLDTSRDFFAYQQDVKTRRAVERNIAIIGEAMNWVLKKDTVIKFSNSRNSRYWDRMIHGYDSASDEIMWGIVVKHLPASKN